MPRTDAVPVQDGLFIWPSSDDGARLITSRCPRCGDVGFPAVAHCRMPACSLTPTQPGTLHGTGTVLSWTVQRYAPPGPFGRTVPYVPLSIALVEFPDPGIAVLGQVFDVASDGDLRTGRRARLVLRTLYAGDDGDVVGWGFTLEPADVR